MTPSIERRIATSSNIRTGFPPSPASASSLDPVHILFADRAPPQRGSHLTLRWREMDSNHCYCGTKSPRCEVAGWSHAPQAIARRAAAAHADRVEIVHEKPDARHRHWRRPHPRRHRRRGFRGRCPIDSGLITGRRQGRVRQTRDRRGWPARHPRTGSMSTPTTTDRPLGISKTWSPIPIGADIFST